MVRISRPMFTWILMFIIQFLLFVCFITKTGLRRYRPTGKPRKSLDLTNDDPVMIKQRNNPAEQTNLTVELGRLRTESEIKDSAIPRTTLSPSLYDADIVIGIPSIKRPEGKIYLGETMKYLIDRRGKVERAIFLVYLAEQDDVGWTANMTKLLKDAFPKELNKNTIRIITPPATLYPDWEREIKITLGDPFRQVMWRSKQVLDAAYLMEYAYGLNTKYYLGIEDDVTAAENYLEKILKHANQNWKNEIIFASFCEQGAIGKLFFNQDLLTVATYLKTFFNYKPLDWLYFDLKTLVGCIYPRTDCEKRAKATVLEYNRSLFHHNGKVSSLVKNKK